MAAFRALGDAAEQCAIAARRIELIAPPQIGGLVRRMSTAVGNLEHQAQPDEWGEGWGAALPRNVVDEIDALSDAVVAQVQGWIHR